MKRQLWGVREDGKRKEKVNIAQGDIRRKHANNSSKTRNMVRKRSVVGGAGLSRHITEFTYRLESRNILYSIMYGVWI